MNLLDAQRALRDELLGDDANCAGRAPGVEVYRNAYRARLMDALRVGFAKTVRWIGDDAFDVAAAHHIITQPPHSWTLDDYGATFPDTLATLFANDPETCEMAWLEWHLQRAFASLDGPVLDAVGLAAQVGAQCDWDTLKFELVSSFASRQVRTQCAALWQSIALDLAPPSSMQLDMPAHLIVWRRAFSPHFKVLDATEFAALTGIANGDTFGAVCSRVAAEVGAAEAVTRVGTWLGQWVGNGLIARARPGLAPHGNHKLRKAASTQQDQQ